jgi:transcriptional regulator with XRE-family HTH domain
VIVLEFLRHERRLSEDEVAESVGISAVDYALIEHGLQKPDDEIGYRLMAKFDYGYRALFVSARELVEEALLKRDLIR